MSCKSFYQFAVSVPPHNVLADGLAFRLPCGMWFRLCPKRSYGVWSRNLSITRAQS
jgi:hypothetical protein